MFRFLIVFTEEFISHYRTHAGHAFLFYKTRNALLHLNNRVFLLRNYRLIVAPRKFDVFKTNIRFSGKYATAMCCRMGVLETIRFPTGNSDIHRQHQDHPSAIREEKQPLQNPDDKQKDSLDLPRELISFLRLMKSFI